MDPVHRPIGLRDHAANSDEKSLLGHALPTPAPSSALLSASSCPSFYSQLSIPSSRKYSSPQPHVRVPALGFHSPPPPLPSSPAHGYLALTRNTWESFGGVTVFFLSVQCLAQGLPAMGQTLKGQSRPVLCACFLRRGISSSWGGW